MNALPVIEKDGQRVLTTKQVAELYNADTKQISRNYERNQNRYSHGVHYYALSGQDLIDFKGLRQNDDSLKFVSVLYLWTERGCLNHAKSLGTDEAWSVYDELVETYFRIKHQMPVLSKELQAIFALDQKTVEIDKRITDFENNMPLFNVECKELQAIVRKKGLESLGGYKSPAYKDNSIRGKIYSDIQRQLKREFGVCRYEAIKRVQLKIAKTIIEAYRAPIVLQDEIKLSNNQVIM